MKLNNFCLPRVIHGQEVPRILVADDQFDNRFLLVTLLEKTGFSIREAANGQEAIELCAEWQPHFVWMDLCMPKVDGWEAAQTIKSTEVGKKTIIAALTGYGIAQDQVSPLMKYFDAIVFKPYRIEEIYSVMAESLRAKNLAAEDVVKDIRIARVL